MEWQTVALAIIGGLLIFVRILLISKIEDTKKECLEMIAENTARIRECSVITGEHSSRIHDLRVDHDVLQATHIEKSLNTDRRVNDINDTLKDIRQKIDVLIDRLPSNGKKT